ncbi:MAG: peptidoglycan bridge formation glycyltransferase FemA/FemB family protein [Anaerolineales bacterium]|nr:peptidoglycan bridge formation glycyltransferase FemA/FemB family protein [Anaerolineales bacterium]
MPQVSLPQWNQFIESQPDAHLLQMGEWGELKNEFGWQAVRLLAEGIGAQILFRRLPLGLSFAYLPKPVFSGNLSAVSDAFWEEVNAVCKKRRAIFLKIEPDVWSGEFHYQTSALRISPQNIQPPRTITISIKEAEAAILARMKPKCRYNIRLAEKKEIRVRVWDDLRAFHALMTVTGGRDGFGVHSEAYYQRAYELFQPKGACELLVAEYAGEPLAALMVFAHGKRAWYVYGASNDRERNRMPTYLLQWEALRWAQARGCEEYDLWGVPDANEDALESQFETRHDGLWGVYRFKRGFGGEVKRAAQAVDRVYNPALYWLYTMYILRKL